MTDTATTPPDDDAEWRRLVAALIAIFGPDRGDDDATHLATSDG